MIVSSGSVSPVLEGKIELLRENLRLLDHFGLVPKGTARR